MSLELIIDIRETKLINYFKDYEFVTVKQLDLGDIIFKYNNDTILIMERKTLKDLASSIKDGRYRQQKSRLLQNYSKDKIIYIIEGNLNQDSEEKINGITIYTLTSTLINNMLRDNLKFYKTIDINETIKFLKNIINKIKKQGLTFLKKKDNIMIKDEFNNSMIKRTKKNNLTPSLCFLGQLCQIPNISINKANSILEKYKSMSNLILKLSTLTDDEKKKELSNIVISQKKNKNNKIVTRKLGKKTSENIINYLYF